MSTRALQLFLLAVSVAISPSLASASPQDHRPDAEAYPCKRAPQFAVTPGSEGFVISARHPAQQKAIAPTPAQVTIGESLKIDLAILSQTIKHREANNAGLR